MAQVTIHCPPLGHTNPPDASGWTTQYVGYPNATVTAQIAGGDFVCHDVVNAAVPLAPFVAQSSHPVPAGFTCTASAPGAPAGFTCVGGAPLKRVMSFACPVTAVSDTLDAPAWSTRHNSGTPIVAVTTATPPTLECAFLASSSFVGPNGTEVATATQPRGALQGCLVAADGKSFSCPLQQVPGR